MDELHTAVAEVEARREAVDVAELRLFHRPLGGDGDPARPVRAVERLRDEIEPPLIERSPGCFLRLHHPLPPVWIDQALQSNDAGKMSEVLKQVRQQYPGGPGTPIPMYGVFINQCIEQGCTREELQSLLEYAKSVKNSDLDGAIKKLEAHVSKK